MSSDSGPSEIAASFARVLASPLLEPHHEHKAFGEPGRGERPDLTHACLTGAQLCAWLFSQPTPPDSDPTTSAPIGDISSEAAAAPADNGNLPPSAWALLPALPAEPPRDWRQALIAPFAPEADPVRASSDAQVHGDSPAARLSSEARRALLLAAFLMPYHGVAGMEKSKSVPALACIVRHSIKLPDATAKLAADLARAAHELLACANDLAARSDLSGGGAGAEGSAAGAASMAAMRVQVLNSSHIPSRPLNRGMSHRMCAFV